MIQQRTKLLQAQAQQQKQRLLQQQQQQQLLIPINAAAGTDNLNNIDSLIAPNVSLQVCSMPTVGFSTVFELRTIYLRSLGLIEEQLTNLFYIKATWKRQAFHGETTK